MPNMSGGADFLNRPLNSGRHSVGIRRCLAIVAALACAALWTGGPTSAQQQNEPDVAADWQLAGLTEAALQLFTPVTGAFFARTQTGLARSDDGGMTWRSVPLPAAPTGVMAVDPTDHTTIYAVALAGLYKTSDDAHTWEVILPPSTNVPVITCWRTGQSYLSGSCADTGGARRVPAFPVDNVVVSLADHQLVFATFAVQNDAITASGLLRSQDGGQTWQPLMVEAKEKNVPLDVAHYTFVAPSATNSDRVFVGSWFKGSHFGDTIGELDQSLDRGTIWKLSGGGSGQLDLALVGGQSRSPAVFFRALQDTVYMHDNYRTSMPYGPALQYPEFRRTDDNGVTWQTVSGFTEEDGSASSAALAQDRMDPERLYSGIGLAESPTGVKTSANGGVTWQELGRQDIGHVNDIAAGIDGKNLYAATDQGIWRLALPIPSQ